MDVDHRRRALPRASMLTLLIAGCALLPAAHAAEPNHDPLEKLNRATYAFNDALDRMLARPAARAYRKVVPETARTAVSNVVANLDYPTTLVNSALQGKFRDAGQDTLRFLVNSTIGVAGIWDPATRFGIPRHDEDFGQTLGRWGVPAGPYLVVPLIGPSGLRDAPARAVGTFTNARHYIGAGTTEYYFVAVDLLDRRSELMAAESALKQAYDPYALVRDAYRQRREYLVHDGNVPEESYEEPLEDPVPVDSPTEAATPPETAADAAAGPGATAAGQPADGAAPLAPASPDAAAPKG